MVVEVWEDFFTDYQTARVLDSSEVFRAYAQAELAREKARKHKSVVAKIEQDNSVLAEIDAMNVKVASNPALKAKLKAARDYLEQHPEMVAKVDPNFVRGLELLDLGD